MKRAASREAETKEEERRGQGITQADKINEIVTFFPFEVTLIGEQSKHSL